MIIKLDQENYTFKTDCGNYTVNLRINYKTNDFTIYKNNEYYDFVFKDTINDTRGLLKLLIEVQTFALEKLKENGRTPSMFDCTCKD